MQAVLDTLLCLQIAWGLFETLESSLRREKSFVDDLLTGSLDVVALVVWSVFPGCQCVIPCVFFISGKYNYFIQLFRGGSKVHCWCLGVKKLCSNLRYRSAVQSWVNDLMRLSRSMWNLDDNCYSMVKSVLKLKTWAFDKWSSLVVDYHSTTKQYNCSYAIGVRARAHMCACC